MTPAGSRRSVAKAGQRDVVRPSADAVIENDAGELALLPALVGRLLPGAGIEAGGAPDLRERLWRGLLIEPG
ncbi:MAG TPA: hypothetical protein VLV15_03725, partial [Dongiaceae bacterium]|nr:hypothetical protein [Dongiaceae bacterium]